MWWILLSAWTSSFLPHWAVLGWIWSFEVQALIAMCISYLCCSMYPSNDSILDPIAWQTCTLWRVRNQAHLFTFLLFLLFWSSYLVVDLYLCFDCEQGVCRNDFKIPKSCQIGTVEGDIWKVHEWWPQWSCGDQTLG